MWSSATGGAVVSSPEVANGVVYVGCSDKNVYALNANTGVLLWRYATGSYVTSSPAVANGLVYVASEDGKMYALNASTGALLWSYATDGRVQGSPAVANGAVYIGSFDHNVYAFGPTRDQAERGASLKPPVLRTLCPDFSLKVSKPSATTSGAKF